MFVIRLFVIQLTIFVSWLLRIGASYIYFYVFEALR